MQIRQILHTLQNITEQPSLMRDIAMGDIDTDSGLVTGDIDEVDAYLMNLNDIAINASEEIEDWMDKKSSADYATRNLNDMLDDFEDISKAVKVEDKKLQQEIDQLIGLVRDAKESIENNPNAYGEPEKECYVYAHIENVTNKVFYIGKGKGNRAWSKHRDLYWKEHVKKLKNNYAVRILHDKLTERESVDIETDYLLQHRDTVINADMPVGMSFEIEQSDSESR